MRGNEMARTDPPWVHDLVDALRSVPTGPREVLPLASALDELRAVAEAATRGRSPGSTRDIRSLREDIEQAVAAAGPAVSERLASLRQPLRREVGQLAQVLKEPAAAALPAVTTRAALRLLVEPAAAADAWDDLVDAWSTGAARTECEQRQAILEDLLVRAGLSPEWELDLARDVLMNRGWGLLVTGGFLGEAFEKDSQGFEIALELPARLARIRRFLPAVLAWRTRSVWFAFTSAVLGVPMVGVGPVQFFPATILDGPVDRDRPLELRQLDERLADQEDDEVFSDPFEEVPRVDVVLARVGVVKHWPNRSPEFARRLVACVVRLAQPTRGWQMVPGAITFEDGWPARQELGDSGWGKAEVPALDLTASLQALPTLVFARLSEGAEAALEMEQSVAWAAPSPRSRIRRSAWHSACAPSSRPFRPTRRPADGRRLRR